MLEHLIVFLYDIFKMAVKGAQKLKVLSITFFLWQIDECFWCLYICYCIWGSQTYLFLRYLIFVIKIWQYEASSKSLILCLKICQLAWIGSSWQWVTYKLFYLLFPQFDTLNVGWKATSNVSKRLTACDITPVGCTL